MVCGQAPSFSTREKSSTARSLMGLTSSKITHFTGVALAGSLALLGKAMSLPRDICCLCMFPPLICALLTECNRSHEME